MNDEERPDEPELEHPRPAASPEEMSPTPADLDGAGHADTEPSTLGAREVAEAIEKGVARILSAFEDKLAFDAHKERQIDRLHEELQGHRRDLLGRAMRPFVSGMVRLHDQVLKTTTGLRGRPPQEQTPERFLAAFATFAEDIVDLLEQNGIEAFTHPGEKFDPTRQTAGQRVPTDDEALAGHIAARQRVGFQSGDMVLQKERVAVYVHQPKETNDP